MRPRQTGPIREYLHRWQQESGGPDEETLRAFGNYPSRGDVQNDMFTVRSPNANSNEGWDEYRNENEDNNAEFGGEEPFTVHKFLKPGDVVELAPSGREPFLAVFIQPLGQFYQFFSVNGRWIHAVLATVRFVVPLCIDPTLVQALVPYMPTKPGAVDHKQPVYLPRQVSAPVQASLQQLTEDSERTYRTNASVLDTAYLSLADPKRSHVMTLAQITKSLLAKGDPTWSPSPAALLAVRKALSHQPFRFHWDYRTARLTNAFTIRARSDVEAAETVLGWVRDLNDHEASVANTDLHIVSKPTKGAANITDFVDKARRLISISRKHREPTPGWSGPSRSRYPLSKDVSSVRITWGESFTDADQKIIRVLYAWTMLKQFHEMPALYSACASILKATGCYGPNVFSKWEFRAEAGLATGFLFLQEIGVLAPHDASSLYDENLSLPNINPSRNVQLLATRAELTRTNPDFRDSMADLRHDWGSTPVYCIDSTETREVDDGISIERIPGCDLEYWVHVHVANPTAFFDKSHVLAGLAAHSARSIYLPTMVLPMLPTWASQGYFSLNRNRPAITFSSRIDTSGNILDYKIQHGIIRNVIRITPTELSDYLGESSEDEITKLVVGGKIPTPTSRPVPTQLSPENVQDLRDLYLVAKARRKQRSLGAIGGYRAPNLANVQVVDRVGQNGMAWIPNSFDRSRVIRGDPLIELTGFKFDGVVRLTSDSTTIVEEMMNVACQIAASWCAERGIPILFRGTVAPPAPSLAEDAEIKSIYDQYAKHGSMSLGMAWKASTMVGRDRAIVHSSPLPHSFLGVPHYAKVTSPLRRFSDMLVHWQIEGALRYEARTGSHINSSLLASSSRSILPFSTRQVQDAILALIPRENLAKKLQEYQQMHWVAMAFMRAFYYKEADLPDTFTAWVRKVQDPDMRANQTLGLLSDFFMPVLFDDAEGSSYQVGDLWEVKLQLIRVWDTSMVVKPVRLLHRDAKLE